MLLNERYSYKKNHSHDSDNSSSHTSSPSSSSSYNSQKIRLNKPLSKKDAWESVTKSLLTIEESGSFKNQTIQSSRPGTIRKKSKLTNNLNQSFDSAVRTNHKIFEPIESDEIINSVKSIEPTSSSCTNFLDILLSEQQLTPSPSSTSSLSSPLSSSNSSINFRSLPIRKRLKKSLSIKSNSSTIQYGVKILNKVFTKNSNIDLAQSKSLSNQKMINRPTTDLFLPSKKTRKYIPFNNGIKNHGNTCFMNCVLQSLFHSTPFVHFFFTEYEKTKSYVRQLRVQNLTNKQLNQFILSEHTLHLLKSLWLNSYDSNISFELKQIIGLLNPTFAGTDQNDSHEFCIWLLDKLSQELTVKKINSRGDLISTSYIDKLFQIEFKSTVTCSKCNYKSSKLETDMMLSLPMPQASDMRRNKSRLVRRLLHIYLITTSEKTLKNLLIEVESPYENIKSKFYIDQLSDRCYKIPSIVNLIVENLFSTLNNSSVYFANCKVNPTFADLRLFLAQNLKINSKNLIFLQMTKLDKLIKDTEQIKDLLFPNFSNSLVPKLYIYEMSEVEKSAKTLEHVIKLLCFNVYETETIENCCHGLPFVVKINRDCSYSDLNEQIINAQSKLHKPVNLEKYKNYFDKLFSIYLVTGDENRTYKISKLDEFPLLIESVEKVLNGTSQTREHLRILIKWNSYDDINYCLNEINYCQVDYDLDKKLTNYDLAEYEHFMNAQAKQEENNIISLENCFDMFTQCEELSDDNSWTCTKCKKQTNAYKKLNIKSLPPILIIHLKRFFYQSRTSNSKLTTPVWFPISKLDMSKYVISDDQSDPSINDTYISSSFSSDSEYIYDLYAVCNHEGRDMVNGHYTAFCKNPMDLKWYCFDDANCIPLSNLNPQENSPIWRILNNGSENIFSENAYILFYKKRQCMSNEKWWINYVDQALLDFDEYSYFLRYYELIESKQNEEQEKKQIFFSSDNFQYFYESIRPKKENRPPEVLRSPGTYLCNFPVNCYDETNRPRRLSNKHRTLSASVNSPSKLNYSNSPSTASSSSKDYANSTDLSSNLNDVNYPMNKLSIADEYLKLPNDNEFIYSASPKPTVLYPQSDFLTKTKMDPQPKNYGRSVNSNPTANRYGNPNSIETSI